MSKLTWFYGIKSVSFFVSFTVIHRYCLEILTVLHSFFNKNIFYENIVAEFAKF